MMNIQNVLLTVVNGAPSVRRLLNALAQIISGTYAEVFA